MNIESVRAHALSSPIDPPQDRTFAGGVRRLHKRDFVLVVLETADGARGYAPAGASSSAMREQFEGASQASFASVLEAQVGPALTSEPIEDIEDAHERFQTLDIAGQLATEAASAVDVAYYDLLGKQHGAPVYELLREGHHEPTTTQPLYASAGMYMEPAGYAEQARTLADLGFFGYKYRPGIGPENDCETVKELHKAVGDEIEIMADAHTWWKLEDASYTPTERAAVIEAYEDADVFWLEEPVAPADYDGYRTLDAESTLDLAGGESEASVGGLLDLGNTGAIEFLQGDVRHHGGFTGCWQAATHCARTDTTYVPHNFGTLLGLVANAHLVAAAPETELLEYPVFENDPHLDTETEPGMYSNELAFDVLADDLDIDDGELTVPDGPGLGVEVDESVLDAYPFVEGPWTEFQYF